MNQLTQACQTILDQLSDAVRQLSEAEYIQPSKTLGGISLGQHLRHTIEFFSCLEQGYIKGIVSYDRRAHDKTIETNKKTALEAIHHVRDFIIQQTNDKPLFFEAVYDLSNQETISIKTNYFRELIYNLEHTVHHMAIMKIGINEVAQHVQLPPHFGVAASTVRYRQGAMA